MKRNNKITVLFVNHSGSDFGGASRALLELAVGLRKKYNINPVVLVPDTGWFTRKLKECNIKFECYPYDWWLSKEPIFSPAEIISLIRLGLKLKKKYRPQIVHTNTSVVWTGFWLSKVMRCKHVWHIREMETKHSNLSYCVPFSWVKRIYQQSDALISISRYIKNEIVNEWGIKRKVYLIYDGIRICEPYEKRNNHICQFAVVGRICKEKNQMLIVQACKELVDAGITDFKINFIGPDDRVLQGFVNKYDLWSYINIVGPCENVDEYLKKMDIGIVASDYEGFGRTTIEFMSNYMPVVGTNTGATNELIIQGKNGWKFETGNKDLLAETMKIAMSSNCSNIQKYARKYAEKYSTENVIEKVERLYEKLLR